MRTIPLALITCSFLWSSTILAAPPAKKDLPATTDTPTQTQGLSTPKKTPRLHVKEKADDVASQKSESPPAKSIRDSNGKFIKKDKTEVVSKTATESDATARCKDGSLSHSKQHSGACSRHGGVSQWLNE